MLSQEFDYDMENVLEDEQLQKNMMYNQFTSYSRVFEQEILDLTVIVEISPQQKNVSNYNTNITLNRNHTIQEISNQVEKVFNENFTKYLNKIKCTRYFYNNTELTTLTHSFRDYNINSNSIINAVIELIPLSQTAKQFAPKESLPIFELNSYRISPEFVDLCRMDIEELSSVDDFQIWNEHGKVHFLEPINMLGMDFRQTLQIGHRKVDLLLNEPNMYEDPKNQEQLSVRAEITYFSFEPAGKEKRQGDSQFMTGIQRWLSSIGGEFVRYSKEEKALTFTVKSLNMFANDYYQ